MKKARVAFSFLLAAGLLFPGQARADIVDEIIKTEMTKRHIPGVALAVVRNGETVKTAGYGLANLELNVPVTSQTVFQIQSVTKTFVSAVILMLLQEGKLSLNEPVGTYLEGSPETWKGITVRHLLTHTSGIKDFVNDPVASLRLDATEEQVFKATIARPLNFPAGEKYSYSNVNYHLLAMIIRKLTGKSYSDFLKERIFQPLNMSETRIMSHTDIIRNRASGYRWREDHYSNGEFVADSILGNAWGGILSTAADMAKWALALESGKLLPGAALDQAWSASRLNDGSASSYGLGWTIEPVDGHRGVGHGGGHTTGFTSYLVVYPDDRLAVVVLTNSSNSRAVHIARNVAGAYIPALAPRQEPAIEDKDPQVTALLRDCMGRAAGGRLEEKRFTPSLWKIIAERKNSIERWLKGLGDIQSLELLSRSTAEDRRSFRYRVQLQQGTVIALIALNSQGEIAEWRMTED